MSEMASLIISIAFVVGCGLVAVTICTICDHWTLERSLSRVAGTAAEIFRSQAGEAMAISINREADEIKHAKHCRNLAEILNGKTTNL